MSRIAKNCPDTVYIEIMVVSVSLKKLHRRWYIFTGIQRLYRRFMVFIADFAHKFSIAFLNMSSVQKHDIDQISCSQSAMDITSKTFFYQIRNITNMIDMGMGKNERVD